MSENKNSFSPFILGFLTGAAFIFFTSTKRGKEILEQFLENKEGASLRIREFIEEFSEKKESNGYSEEQNELDHIRQIQEKGRIFGHRFFRRKKVS